MLAVRTVGWSKSVDRFYRQAIIIVKAQPLSNARAVECILNKLEYTRRINSLRGQFLTAFPGDNPPETKSPGTPRPKMKPPRDENPVRSMPREMNDPWDVGPWDEYRVDKCP